MALNPPVGILPEFAVLQDDVWSLKVIYCSTFTSF
jgi:hypothetical protein